MLQRRLCTRLRDVAGCHVARQAAQYGLSFAASGHRGCAWLRLLSTAAVVGRFKAVAAWCGGRAACASMCLLGGSDVGALARWVTAAVTWRRIRGITERCKVRGSQQGALRRSGLACKGRLSTAAAIGKVALAC